ncbi:transcription cofactor vestigial-like protein 1 [Rhineura floridana]|uniref:transcription cofactor vestigial-like protein 1 n=1 Tax=Rhineura floridana TaxID=261503 RepID=UPI002AC89427|nr:transcription cofactor vestigial-like protein 1 [Rhineura floridana]
MEDSKKNPAKLSKNRQPVKTEWGAQYVVFTYFQGDINSVVDEHFSRALSTSKNPQDLSRRSSGEEDAIVKNEHHLTPQQWNFSPQWAKPYHASPPLNLSSADDNTAAATTGPYQPPVLQGVAPPTTELWHLPSGGNPNLTAASGYPPSISDLHMTQGTMSDEKYGSLLGLLQQERCPSSLQEHPGADSGSACPTSSARLQNTSQSLTSGGGIPANDRRRDLYF